MILDAANLVRTGQRRVYTDAPTAGSLWDLGLGSDWPARDNGVALLAGLDSDTPATRTEIARGRAAGVYQAGLVERVEVGDRVLYLGTAGYGEGYAYALCETAEAAQAALEESRLW